MYHFSFLLSILLDVLLNEFYIRVLRDGTEKPNTSKSDFISVYNMSDWIRLIWDGIRHIILVCIVLFIIMVPIILMISLAIGFENVFSYLQNYKSFIFGVNILLALLSLFIAFIVALPFLMGYIRFAKEGRFWAVFEIPTNIRGIKLIGWKNYILNIISMLVILLCLGILIQLITPATHVVSIIC